MSLELHPLLYPSSHCTHSDQISLPKSLSSTRTQQTAQRQLAYSLCLSFSLSFLNKMCNFSSGSYFNFFSMLSKTIG